MFDMLEQLLKEKIIVFSRYIYSNNMYTKNKKIGKNFVYFSAFFKFMWCM